MKLKKIAMLLITSLLLLSGCGGGGTTAPPADTVSGVAAAGLAIVGNVSLKDAAGVELSKAVSDGKFSFDVAGLTKPFMLKAVGTANGRNYTLYSLVPDRGTGNVNPMSNLVVATAASGADLASVYAAPAQSGIQTIAGNLTQALADVQSTLKPILQKYGVPAVDPIGGAFRADGTGLDHMLDLVTIEVASGNVTITDNGSTPITKDVATGFTTHAVSGVVTIDGSPFPGVTVTVSDGTLVYGSATSQADGSYRIANVPQGSFTVTPAKSGYSFDRAGSTAVVSAGDCEVAPFTSSRPFTVSGTVTGSNGRGVAGVTVTAQRDGTITMITAITDGRGRYSFSSLVSGGYTVTPSRTDLANARPVVFDAVSKRATISSSANYATVDFTAEIAAYTLSGIVVTQSGGSPMAGVQVTLSAKNNIGTVLTSADATFRTVTDAAGAFSLSGIPDGYYALGFIRTGYGFALQDAYATHGVTGDNFSINGADLRLDFSGRAVTDANGGVSVF